MSDWFLPAAERPWTSGNLVIPHVHGANYFARLLEVIGETEAGDRIFLTDWRGDADERMADGGEVDADLVGPAGLRPQLQPGQPRGQDAVEQRRDPDEVAIGEERTAPSQRPVHPASEARGPTGVRWKVSSDEQVTSPSSVTA